MNYKWSRIAPRWAWLGGFAVIYALTYCYRPAAEDKAITMAAMRLVMITVLSGLYGILRVVRFNPIFRPGYYVWLQITPWDGRGVFPFGPAHLVWVDVVLMAAAGGLILLDGRFNPVLAADVFLAAYLLAWTVTFDSRRIGCAVAGLFLAPLVIYPHRNPYIALAVLLCIYGLYYVATRRQWRDFPWNTNYWLLDPTSMLRRQAELSNVVGWPWCDLRPAPEQKQSVNRRLGMGLVFGLLVAWWTHIAGWLLADVYSVTFIASMAITFMAIRRIGVYIKTNYPPMNLLGRVATLRLIIPGYDVLLLGPLGMAAVLMAAWGAWFTIAYERAWEFEAAMFVSVVIMMIFPPSVTKWKLIGHHRIVKGLKTAQQHRVIPQQPPNVAGSVVLSSSIWQKKK